MFLRVLAVVLESIFLVGLAGSLVVAIMAFVGDVHVFFDKDDVKDKEPTRSHSTTALPTHL
jgi:hypothetical protein